MNQIEELTKNISAIIPEDMPVVDVISVMTYFIGFACIRMGMNDENLQQFQNILSLSLATAYKAQKGLTD